MALVFGIKAIHQASASARPHILGHAIPRSIADDGLFEVWNGEISAARILRVNKDGQIQAQNGTAAAPALAPEGDKDTGIYFVTGTPEVAVGVAGVKRLSVVAAGVDVAGTLGVSGAITGALTGNASTATTLQTARTINGTSFNGSANITVTAAAGTLTGTALPAAVVTSSLQTVGVLTALQVDNVNVNLNTISSTTGALNLTPAVGSAVVLDGTINVDAGVVTGATSVTSTTFVGALTGNASTATTLQTARTINGTSFNGSVNITVTAAANTLTGTVLNAPVVTSSLTAVGTIATGVWQGTAIANAYLAALDAAKLTGTVASARLGTGTANASTYLRGDQTWATISGGATSLTDLSDVSTAGLTNRFVLVANGTSYVGRNLEAVDIASGTFANARIAASNVTQHQASLSIAATQLTGTINTARIAGSYTGITAVGTLASLTVTGTTTAGAINLGSTTITNIISVSASMSHPSLDSLASSEVTATVTGAAVGDIVIITPLTNSNYLNHACFRGYVSSADTVTVSVTNVFSSNISFGTGNIRITVLKL